MEQVLPIILLERPKVNLKIFGADAGRTLLKLNNPNIEVVGWVDDLQEELKNCAVAVIPLQNGSGMKFKLLESMVVGLPIVSTTEGASGIDIEQFSSVIIEDSPKKFAKRVIEVLDNLPHYNKLAERSKSTIISKFNWNRHVNTLLKVYRKITDNVP